MKLASLKNGTRDGGLVVVSKDLRLFAYAERIAPSLQSALDNWGDVAPQLERLALDLNSGSIASHAFVQDTCHSPLPRAYQWADGSSYINHVELVRKSRGSQVPKTFYTDPLIYQGGSDSFMAPYDPLMIANPAWGYDLEGEVAVITDDVPVGVNVSQAADHIKLIMLCNDVSLRGLIPNELAKGFGFFQSKPPTAFSPVCVTPDELAGAWKDSLIQLPLIVDLNGKAFGRANPGVDATFNLAQLVSHAAKTRPLVAGTIIGSGTISNRDTQGGPGRPVSEGGLGYSCIAEIRVVELLAEGSSKTPFLQEGDILTIEMCDKHGNSIFGRIHQTVVTRDA